jgi:hypothetical protein
VIAEPAKAALRKARRAQRPPRKFCPLCFEEHHLLGKKNDPHLIIELCQYHHASIHDQMLDEGIDLRVQLNPVMRQAMKLKAEAVFFRNFAEAKERQAETLLKYLEREDAK